MYNHILIKYVVTTKPVYFKSSTNIVIIKLLSLDSKLKQIIQISIAITGNSRVRKNKNMFKKI